MIGPDREQLEDLLEWWPLTAFWVAGWLVGHSPIPEQLQTVLAVLLGLAPFVALVVIARYTALELTGGRCRARNKGDGERCSLHRPPNADLCHVHQRTHGVELVEQSSEMFSENDT